MLDQELISIGKLKTAYRLNAHDAGMHLSAFARMGCLDVYALWSEANHFVAFEEHSKKSFYADMEESYFPDVKDLSNDLLQERIATKRLLRYFLHSSRNKKPREYLQRIFDRVVHFTYDDPDAQHVEVVNQILDLLYEHVFDYHGDDKVDIAWALVRPVLFTKFCSFFDDAISVNKEAAVRHMDEHGYAQVQEVKGLSFALGKRILANPPAPTRRTQIMLPSQPTATVIRVPRTLWEAKSPEAVRNGMREEGFHDAIIAYVLVNWCNVNKTKSGTLLGERDDDEVDSAARHRIYKLLKEAATFTITTD